MFNRQINTVETLDKASLKHERAAFAMAMSDDKYLNERASAHFVTSEQLRLMADRLDVSINPS